MSDERDESAIVQEYGLALRHVDHVLSHGLHCRGCDEAHTWLRRAGVIPEATPSGTWLGSTIRAAALEEAAQLVENECQCSHGSSLYDAASRIRALKGTPWVCPTCGGPGGEVDYEPMCCPTCDTRPRRPTP